MKKFSYRSASQRKRSLKYGGYATVTTIILLAALVLFNVLFSQLKLKVDLTGNDIYTPGATTMKILDSLEDDVTVYGLYNQGTEENETNRRVIKLVEAYCDLSKKVKFVKVDPLSDPTFANQFLMDTSNTLDNGSLIVQNDTTKKFKTIPINNMYVTQDDYSTLTHNVTGFSAEEALTSAIQYVCLQDTPVLYQLQGHSETLLSSDFTNYLSYTNYKVDTLNLVTQNISDLEANDYTVVLVNNPREDLTDGEYQTLLNFMEQGGRMMFLAANDTPSLPNFDRLLSRYGLSIQAGTMVETNSSNYYTYPFIIKPELNSDSEITKYQFEDQNNYVLMTLPAAINISDDIEEGETVTKLVTTSDGAILKGEGNNTVVYEDGDTKGPFTLAVSAEEQVSRTDGTLGTTKMVVIGNSDFINNSSNSVVVTGNYRLVTIAADYLQESTTELYISNKNIEEGKISTTQSDFFVTTLIFVVLIPAAIIIAGIVIYQRRRHR